MKIESSNDINKELLDIWKEFAWTFVKETETSTEFLSPCFFPDDIKPEHCKLLVMGLNPSYSEPGWKKILKSYIKNNPERKDSESLDKLIKTMNNGDGKQFKSDLDDYFSYKNLHDKQNEILKLDITAGDAVDYFKKVRELRDFLYPQEVDGTYSHHDLYFYRKTDHKHLLKLIKDNKAFFERQLDLSKAIIKWLDPEIILVANADASRIFMINFKTELESVGNLKMKDEIGTYEMNINQNKIIPVFLSGMLSGGAMDNYSYERLKWHMKAVSEGKKMKFL